MAESNQDKHPTFPQTSSLTYLNCKYLSQYAVFQLSHKLALKSLLNSSAETALCSLTQYPSFFQL